MKSLWALQDAKSKFSSVVNQACNGEPQIVTRRGIPVAVLLSFEDYKKINPRALSPIKVLLGGPKVDNDFVIERDKSMIRKVDFK